MLAGCAAAPTDGGDRRRRLGLPALHGLRLGWVRRQVVQPARPRGPRGRRRRSSAPSPSTVESDQRRRLRPEHREPDRRRLQPDRHRRLPALGRDRRGRRRQPRRQLRDRRRRLGRRLRRQRPTSPNSKPILFDTAQAAFLAGYAAASYSKTGVVGTFGGIQIPTVTIFMDGFVEGVAYYNEAEGHRRQGRRLGPGQRRRGTFTGGFAADVEAKTAAQSVCSTRTPT